MVTLIGQLAGDPSNNTWPSSVVQAKIEKAQEKFVLATRCLKDVATPTTLVVDQAEYSLPADVLDIERVVHNGKRLSRTSKFDLYFYVADNWTDDKGSPIKYYVDLDPNNKKIGVYKLPQAADTAYPMGIEYLKIPPALSSDSSLPFDGHTLLSPYHDALAYWSARELLKEMPSTENIARMNVYKQSYDELVSECIETFRRMGETTPWRMRGGRYFNGL